MSHKPFQQINSRAFIRRIQRLKIKECQRQKEEQKKIKNCDEISKLIKAFPKDIAALDKRVLQFLSD